MKYCGISKPLKMSVGSRPSMFNRRGVIAESLGDKILKSIEMGADLGAPEPVKYDEQGQDGVDVMTDPNHDFFDIAEQYGEKIADSVGKAFADPAPSASEGANPDPNPDPVTE